MQAHAIEIQHQTKIIVTVVYILMYFNMETNRFPLNANNK